MKTKRDSFAISLLLLTMAFAGFIISLLVCMAARISFADVQAVFTSGHIHSSVLLTVLTSSISAVVATFLSVSIGFALARQAFPGRSLVEAVCTIPISAPPLVTGLALLIFFQSAAGTCIEETVWRFTFQPSGIILAQSLISTAYGIATMKAVFQQRSVRQEHIAMTFGCRPREAFFRVTIPEVRHAIFGVTVVAWAHCLGIFGPILVFAGMVRGRTEVLSTTIWLELQSGNLEAAIVVSLALIFLSVLAMTWARRLQISKGPHID